MDQPILSVVICTHNRSAFQKDVVDSLIGQDYPASRYEIIIVDNASTDDTRQVVQRLQTMLPSLRYVYEPLIGLSNARNAGAQSAHGNIVVYIDDDAIAEPTWLSGISAVFENLGAQTWCVGGAIDLQWEQGSRPSWLPGDLDGYFGSTAALGSELRQLHSPLCPNGGNLAVRRDRLLELGGFSSQLGRIGSSLLSNEEAGLCNAIRDSGGKIWYTPQALVHHRVQAPLVTRRRLLKRAYWQGVSDVKVDQLNSRRTDARLKHLVAESLAFIREGLRCIGGVGARDRRILFSRTFYLVCRLGRISQYIQRAPTTTKTP